MASFDKMAKSLIEETAKTGAMVSQLTRDTALVKAIVQNQEVMIVQNQKMIDLLNQLQTVLTEKETG